MEETELHKYSVRLRSDLVLIVTQNAIGEWRRSPDRNVSNVQLRTVDGWSLGTVAKCDATIRNDEERKKMWSEKSTLTIMAVQLHSHELTGIIDLSKCLLSSSSNTRIWIYLRFYLGNNETISSDCFVFVVVCGCPFGHCLESCII